jgi:hypothetical protein
VIDKSRVQDKTDPFHNLLPLRSDELVTKPSLTVNSHVKHDHNTRYVRFYECVENRVNIKLFLYPQIESISLLSVMRFYLFVTNEMLEYCLLT